MSGDPYKCPDEDNSYRIRPFSEFFEEKLKICRKLPEHEREVNHFQSEGGTLVRRNPKAVNGVQFLQGVPLTSSKHDLSLCFSIIRN